MRTGLFTAAASSGSGAGAPGVVTNVVGTQGVGQIGLTWSAPVSNGGSAITDYIVQYSSDSGSTWTTFVDSVSVTASTTVTGLAAGTSYVFRVLARNVIGDGPYSATSAAVTNVSVPTAPTSLSASPGINIATISFTAPSSNGGSAVTNYEYSFNNSTWTALSPVDTTSPVSITGLSEGTAYTVYLRAVNANGVGDSSAGVSFTQLGLPQASGPAAHPSPYSIDTNPQHIKYVVFSQSEVYNATNLSLDVSTTSNFASYTTYSMTPSSVGSTSTQVNNYSVPFPTNSIYYYLRPRFTIAGETFVGNTQSQLYADY